MVEGSVGSVGHVEIGQSLPLRNAGASRNCGRSAVAGERKRRRRRDRMSAVALISGGMVMVVVVEEEERNEAFLALVFGSVVMGNDEIRGGREVQLNCPRILTKFK